VLCALGLVSGTTQEAKGAAQAAAIYTSDSKAQAIRSKADFAVDGELSKEIWRRAAWFEYDRNPSGKQHYPKVRTRAAVVWTRTYVYIAFACRYESLNIFPGEDPKKERWELWNKDVAEVFLNPQPAHVNHYYEFEIAPNNQWIDLEIDKDKTPFNDAAWNSGYEHATRIDEKKHEWTAELRIPVSSMKVEAMQAGMQWRANFFRAAGQGGDEGRQFMTWSTIPDGKTFHVPTRFGILEFVEENGAAAN
jgi:alpha-galactosidase